jgi:excinuclease UvrABC nuclease subunit
VKRCPAPCRGELGAEAAAAYRIALDEACSFLGGERDDLMDKLRRQMLEAAARQDFERAARLRNAIRDADQVLLGQRLVTGAVEANNLLIIYPSALPELVELYLIRHGRLARQRRVPHNTEVIADELRTLVGAANDLGVPPARVGREEVDQINIIARWIHHHSDEHERAFFRLPMLPPSPEEIDAFVERVLAGLAARGEEALMVADAADGFDGTGEEDRPREFPTDVD